MKNKLKTLVIHPHDPSTDFLNVIYAGQKDWTVVTEWGNEMPRSKLIQLIKDHDRIIMMGHGAPTGLFYTHINSKMVYLLREKECVCIWCNADQFVNKYGLRGFFTGMFISEVLEAPMFGITTNQEDIDISNGLFVNIVTEFIDDYKLHSHLKETYVSDTCPVIQFNTQRLYYRDEESILNDKELKQELDDFESNMDKPGVDGFIFVS